MIRSPYLIAIPLALGLAACQETPERQDVGAGSAPDPNPPAQSGMGVIEPHPQFPALPDNPDIAMVREVARCVLGAEPLIRNYGDAAGYSESAGEKAEWEARRDNVTRVRDYYGEYAETLVREGKFAMATMTREAEIVEEEIDDLGGSYTDDPASLKVLAGWLDQCTARIDG